MKNITVYGLLIIAINPCLAVAQNLERNPLSTAKKFDVIISEVMYYPLNGASEWVEIANVSDTPVDIAGWSLVDGQSIDFTISANSLIIPPKNFLTLILDGTGGAPTPFNQNKAIVHSPKGFSGNILGDKGGQIALYSKAINLYEPAIVKGYTAWGRSPGRVLADAMSSGRWSYLGASPGAIVLGTRPEIYTFFVKGLKQGGSVGLVNPIDRPGLVEEKWGVFSPTEVNPGEMELKRGIVLGRPFDGERAGEDGKITLNVVGMGEDFRYQFQVCSDKECKNVFLDYTGDQDNYLMEKPIPKNKTYYWRARLFYPDGSVGSWSEVRSLTNGFKKQVAE